jgi:hypothetical protein
MSFRFLIQEQQTFMKRTIQYMLGLVISVFMASCAYDNYEPPKSYLKGKIMYNGEAINVASGEVQLRLIEPGWVRQNPIDIQVAQDGSFSALLFDATYKLYIPGGQGPYRTILNQETNSDTILVSLKGSKEMNIEVLPYYMLRSPAFSMSAKKLTATCRLEKIITDANARNIDRVFLYVSKTQFVDNRTSIVREEDVTANMDDLNNVTLSVNVPAVPLSTQSYVYARIGVKIAGVDDLLFSPVQKLDIQ